MKLPDDIQRSLDTVEQSIGELLYLRQVIESVKAQEPELLDRHARQVAARLDLAGYDPQPTSTKTRAVQYHPPRSPGIEAQVTEAGDFDPTLADGGFPDLARAVNAALDRVRAPLPPGFREALWGVALAVHEVPAAADITAARLMYEVGTAQQRKRWIARLQREMEPDCLACTPDEPCQACLQTARIVGMLEGGA